MTDDGETTGKVDITEEKRRIPPELRPKKARGRKALGLPPTEKQLKALEEHGKKYRVKAGDPCLNPGGRPKRKPYTERLQSLMETPYGEVLKLDKLKLPTMVVVQLGLSKGAIKGNAANAKEIRETLEGRLPQAVSVTMDDEGRTEADLAGRIAKLQALKEALDKKKTSDEEE